MTRTALPENDSYIFKLGIAVYSFASVLTFLCEVMCLLEPSLDRASLQSRTAGKIHGELKTIQSTRIVDEISDNIQIVINLFEKYKNLRDDIIHSYCITGSNGNQILYRNNGASNFEVTEDFLDSFISEFGKITDNLYKIRSFLRSMHT